MRTLNKIPFRKLRQQNNRVLIDLLAIKAEYEQIKDKDRDAIICLLKFVLKIKDKLTYSDIMDAMTSTGYTVVYKNDLGITTVGEGKKLIELISKNK